MKNMKQHILALVSTILISTIHTAMSQEGHRRERPSCDCSKLLTTLRQWVGIKLLGNYSQQHYLHISKNIVPADNKTEQEHKATISAAESVAYATVPEEKSELPESKKVIVPWRKTVVGVPQAWLHMSSLTIAADVRYQMARQHEEDIRTGHTPFELERDGDLLLQALDNAMTTYYPGNNAKGLEYFTNHWNYQIVEKCLSLDPSIITYHDRANTCVFDWGRFLCFVDNESYARSNALLRLLLEHKANPNMQDKKGDTWLMRKLRLGNFAHDCCPDRLPFLAQCAHQLDLTIANNQGETVFHILKSHIKCCNEHIVKSPIQCDSKCKIKCEIPTIRDSYLKFTHTLLAIRRAQQKANNSGRRLKRSKSF